MTGLPPAVTREGPARTMEMRRYGGSGSADCEEDDWPLASDPSGGPSEAARLAQYVSEGLTRVVSDTDLGSLIGEEASTGRSPEREASSGGFDDARLLAAACKLPSSGFAPPLPTPPRAGDPDGRRRNYHQAHCTFDDLLGGGGDAAPDAAVYTHSTMIDACRLPRDVTKFAAPLAEEPARFDPVNDEREIGDETRRPPPPPVSDDAMIDACTLPSHAASKTPDPYAAAIDDLDVFDDGSGAAPKPRVASPPPHEPRPLSRDARPVSVQDLISACTLPKHAVSSPPDPYASDFGDCAWAPPAGGQATHQQDAEEDFWV